MGKLVREPFLLHSHSFPIAYYVQFGHFGHAGEAGDGWTADHGSLPTVKTLKGLQCWVPLQIEALCCQGQEQGCPSVLYKPLQ